MIRVLILITVTGFILSVASLSGAFAIGGPDLISRGGWAWVERHGGDDFGDGGSDAGPQASRTLAWSGSEELDIDLAADVRYVQSTGPASVVVTGPRRAVDRVVISGDSIRYEHGRRHGARRGPKLTIVVTAPNITSFDLSGRNTLAIEGYRQERLKIDVSGEAEVTASGEAGQVDLDLSGEGDVNLGALKTGGASVEISGDADATIAPTDWARLDISGSGDVRLLTTPKQLETDISGSGRVTQGTNPTPPSTPEPPKAPAGAKT
jgi:hypothetical protein